MPKRVQARAAQNEQEEREVHKLARSHHAPSDWKFHAQMIIQSWAGKSPQEIATELKCHPKTVRTHLARFNREGISGLGMRSGSGRKPRLTELERSRILALVKLPPPGRLMNKAQHNGAWMPSQKRPMLLVSRSNVAKSVGFISGKACVGAVPTVGETATTKTLSQKDRGRHPLHPAARRVDDRLHG